MKRLVVKIDLIMNHMIGGVRLISVMIVFVVMI